MTRQYLGARYVPKIYTDETGSSDWKDSVSYEALTIVTYLGNSYTSKKPVPIGVQIDDTEYWVLTSGYNVQVEQLRQLLDYKTSNEYIGDIVEDKLSTSAVNRWNTDVEADVLPNFTPATIPFETINRGVLNFNKKFVVKKWMTAPTVELQNAVCPLEGKENFDMYMKQDGIVLKNITNSNSNMQTLFIENNIKPGSYIGFTVDCGNSNNTEYVRLGLRQNCYLFYFDNYTKKLLYETDNNSWTPTPVNDKQFNSGLLDIIIGYAEGKQMNVFARQDNNPYEYLGSFTTNGDNKVGNTLIFARLGGNTELNYYLGNYEYFYSGVSFADCRYIHYEDTTPFISNNKAYLTANLQDGYGVGCTAIVSHTLGANDFEIIGVVYSLNDPTAIGSDICFDRKNKRFICSFRQDTSDGTRITYGFSYMSELSGVNEFDSEYLPSVTDPTLFGTMKNDEDPTICFFDGHWYYAINRAANSTSSTFYYEVFKSKSDEFVLEDFEHYHTLNGDLTGGSFIVLGNKLYFVCGNGSRLSSFNLSDKTIDGNLQLPDILSNRVWGNITSVVRGSKLEFYITTFDRTRVGSGNWTYGAYQMFKSSIGYNQKSRPITYGTR